MAKTIGFIGLGNLGYHLANSLQKAGFKLVVNDLDKSIAQGLLDGGAEWAESAKEVGISAETVITCLPSVAVVTAVVEGENGILSGMSVGNTWIDTSTNDYDELKRLAEVAEAHGINCLECPVTGGVHLAASGEITVLVGGDEATFNAQRDVLNAMGSPVLYMGKLGSASIIKVITNMLAFINLVSLGEAYMVAKRAGLDLANSWEAILNSSGNSFVHETEGQLILNGSYDIAFTNDLTLKDLGLVHKIAHENGVPLELAGMVQQIFVKAKSVYGGDAQSTQVVKLLEDALQTDLRAPDFPARLEA